MSPLPDTGQAASAVVFDPVANLGPGEVLVLDKTVMVNGEWCQRRYRLERGAKGMSDRPVEVTL